MAKTLSVRQSRRMPRMGWLVECEGTHVVATIGSDVRWTDSSVFEGGWAYTDGPEQLSTAGVFLGSGVVVSGDDLHVITPTHLLEPVYVVRGLQRVIISNSLARTMAVAGITEFDIAKLSSRLWTIKHGIDKYRRKVFHRGRTEIWRYGGVLLTMDRSGDVTESRYRDPFRVTSYESYLHYITTVVREVQLTSGFQQRVVPLSRGYDSVACASLAKRLGGGLSVTLEQARDLTSDGGQRVAAALDMESVTIERPDREYVTYPAENKAEGFDRKVRFSLDETDELKDRFAGLGFLDEPLRLPAALLDSSVLLTGFFGDHLWGRLRVTNDYARGDVSGCSLAELRQRSGFVHIPVPMLAALQQSAVRSITDSAEMAPWTVDRWYDRPVARRMAEEMGVPRKLFGQRKRAIATIVDNHDEMATAVLNAQLQRARDEHNLVRASAHEVAVR